LKRAVNFIFSPSSCWFPSNCTRSWRGSRWQYSFWIPVLPWERKNCCPR